MDDNGIKIGLIGAGTGGPSSYHARSFSSIINGFDPEKVPEDWPVHKIRAHGARIESVWDENIDAAGELAGVFSIPRVEKKIEDVIKNVDGVIIVDDITMTHQKRAPFFLKEGLPVFIDKPLSNNVKEAYDLISIAKKNGALLMSTSALRYSKEALEAEDAIKNAGPVDCAVAICQGQYMGSENLIHYGIHPLELAYSILGAGAEFVQNIGEKGRNIVKISYRDGRTLMLLVFPEMAQIFQLNLYGKEDAVSIVVEDWDYFYWSMLDTFIRMINEKKPPVPLSETLEIIQILTLGMESLKKGGIKIPLTL
jgi:predicted dehydrogenase